MSADHVEAKKAARAADPNKWLGLPIPIWVALITAASGLIGTYIGQQSGKAASPTNQRSLNQVNGEIRSPKPDTTLADPAGTIDCEGTVEGLGAGLHLWLAIERDGYIWPKADDFQFTDSGGWKKSIVEDGDPKQPFSVTLFVANDEAHKTIRDWFREGELKNDFARLDWIRGINRLDRVDRLHQAPKP